MHIFPQNRATHFDETFYVALVLPGEGFWYQWRFVTPFKREAAGGQRFLVSYFKLRYNLRSGQKDLHSPMLLTLLSMAHHTLPSDMSFLDKKEQ